MMISHSQFEDKYTTGGLSYKLGVHTSSELLVRWWNSFGNPLTHLSVLGNREVVSSLPSNFPNPTFTHTLHYD